MENFFKNKTVVFTGDLSIQRDYAKSKIISLGGRVTTAPSKKTNYMVVGADPGPVKMKKATDLNIQILYEREFLKILNEAEKALDSGMAAEQEISSDFDDNSVFDTIDDIQDNRKEDNIKDNKGDDKKEDHNLEDSGNMWSEKYRPTKRSELVGNQSVLSSLSDFLLGKTNYMGALLSGTPGVGKTTSVHILCKELGLELVEFNASDVRNKSLIIKKIKCLVNTKGISWDAKLRNKVILMDEIDGMTSDRGGLMELNVLIKESSVPIVCICNDRTNLKIRTLAKNCLDLKFKNLDSIQIAPRIRYILKQENKSMKENELNAIIFSSNGDLRYILNTVQKMCLRDKIHSGDLDVTRKTPLKNVFDVVGECFRNKTINEKTNLYFEDYSLIPLFISENYLKLPFKNINELYTSADSISNGDTIEKLIRGSTQEWSLAPLHGFFTVCLPTYKKVINKRVDFPSWLGQNSRHLKCQRNLKEISLHSTVKTNLLSFRQYESNLIFTEFIFYLKNDRVKDAINLLVEYNLLKDDLINLSDILIGGSVLYKDIKTKTKGDLTRAYNKLKRHLPYVVEDVKKKKVSQEIEDTEEEDELY